MAFRLEFSEQAERDFGLIFDHLLESYLGFGEGVEIRATANRILTAPHRGERHDDILPGLRHLTINRAIYWFDVYEERETIRILAVFFGGQDHVRHMLARIIDS